MSLSKEKGPPSRQHGPYQVSDKGEPTLIYCPKMITLLLEKEGFSNGTAQVREAQESKDESKTTRVLQQAQIVRFVEKILMG